MEIKFKNKVNFTKMMFIVVLSILVFLGVFFAPNGYKVVINGKQVGAFYNKAEFFSNYEKVLNKIKSEFKDAKFSDDIRFYKCRMEDSNLDSNLIAKYIEDSCDVKVKAIVVKKGNEEILYLKNKDEINKTLDKIKEYYASKSGISKVEGYTLLTELKYSEKELDKNKIINCESAAKKLINEGKPLINLKIYGVGEEKQSITPAVVIEGSSDMLVGESKVKSDGKEGLKIVTKKVTTENDKKVEEKIIKEDIIKNCEDKVVVKGTKKLSILAAANFHIPSRGVVSSEFGERWGRLHKGIDIAANIGTPIYAAEDGVVIFSGTENGYGKVVKIQHEEDVVTVYGHCSKLLVEYGEEVSKGQEIAKVGNTGDSTGPHVHFEVRINGEPKNPKKFLQGLE